jgi:hypothetical protein
MYEPTTPRGKTMPEPTVRPTRYEVNCLPEEDINARLFALTVEYRGRELWAVRRGTFHDCLGVDGTWDHEPNPSNRDDDWLAAHRFDLDTALRLAKEAAPKVTVNGWTVQRALAVRGEGSEDRT